jgi:hypothetical protein
VVHTYHPKLYGKLSSEIGRTWFQASQSQKSFRDFISIGKKLGMVMCLSFQPSQDA